MMKDFGVMEEKLCAGATEDEAGDLVCVRGHLVSLFRRNMFPMPSELLSLRSNMHKLPRLEIEAGLEGALV